MKSAYELAMERLNKSAPSKKLSDTARTELAELDSLYSAKIAEKEIFLKGELAKALGSGDYETIQQIERQLRSERSRLQDECEAKKEAVRQRDANAA